MSLSDREYKTPAIEDTSAELCWKDLIFLHRCKIGLASVENKEAALLAEKKGGITDALSLAAFAYPGADCPEIDSQLKASGNYGSRFANCHYLFKSVFLDEKQVDAFCPQDKQTLLRRLEDGIIRYIEKTLDKHAACQPAFLFITRNVDILLPYRLDENPLGFDGRAVFKNHDVRKTFVAGSDTWNVFTFTNAIIAGIKEARINNKILPKNLELTQAVISQYRTALTKRHLSPDKSREPLLSQLESELKLSETQEDAIDALIKTARDLRAPNPNGSKKFGFSIFGLHHVGDYKKSDLYILIEKALHQLDPLINLEVASAPDDLTQQKKHLLSP